MVQGKENFQELVQFLGENRNLVENYPWGGAMSLPPCPNEGHCMDTEEKVVFAWPSKEIEVAPCGSGFSVSKATYDADDWDRDCPLRLVEKRFASVGAVTNFIAKEQGIPVQAMANWLAAFRK